VAIIALENALRACINRLISRVGASTPSDVTARVLTKRESGMAPFSGL
jgi:hypothetical protein